MPGSWWCIRSCMDTSASPRMNSDSRRQTNASGRTTPRSWTISPATLLSSRSHLQWRPFLSGTSYLQALQRLTLCYHARVSWRIRLISLAPPSAYYSPWRSADYPPRTRTGSVWKNCVVLFTPPRARAASAAGARRDCSRSDSSAGPAGIGSADWSVFIDQRSSAAKWGSNKVKLRADPR